MSNEREAAINAIEEKYGFRPSQLCLMLGSDLEWAFQAGAEWQRSQQSAPDGYAMVPVGLLETAAFVLDNECFDEEAAAINELLDAYRASPSSAGGEVMRIDIFVFGSNLAGRHGKGAALFAKNNRGAIYGRGTGRQGDSYAIPTKDATLKPLSLSVIEMYVKTFIAYAKDHPQDRFEVTKVGCGLAGYAEQDIAPMFASAPSNCLLPEGWRESVLKEKPHD